MSTHEGHLRQVGVLKGVCRKTFHISPCKRVLGTRSLSFLFKDTSTLVGHFGSSHRERTRSNRGADTVDEKKERNRG